MVSYRESKDLPPSLIIQTWRSIACVVSLSLYSLARDSSPGRGDESRFVLVCDAVIASDFETSATGLHALQRKKQKTSRYKKKAKHVNKL